MPGPAQESWPEPGERESLQPCSRVPDPHTLHQGQQHGHPLCLPPSSLLLLSFLPGRGLSDPVQVAIRGGGRAAGSPGAGQQPLDRPEGSHPLTRGLSVHSTLGSWMPGGLTWARGPFPGRARLCSLCLWGETCLGEQSVCRILGKPWLHCLLSDLGRFTSPSRASVWPI